MKLSKKGGKSSSSAGRSRKQSTRTAPTYPPKLIELLKKLKPYQRVAVEHNLCQPYGGVLLDPGLGKTLVTLVTFWILKRLGYVDWLLVAAPLLPAYQVWGDGPNAEVAKWKLPFKVTVLHGDEKDEKLEKEPADIYVVTYAGLEWLLPRIETLTSRGTGWFVPDEATKLKNHDSLQHRNAAAIAPCFGRRTVLTGTPIPKGYIDLWGLMKIVDGGKRLGHFITIYRRWFNAIDETGTAYSLKPDENGIVKRRPKSSLVRYEPTEEGKKEIEKRVADCLIWFSDADLGLPRWRDVPIYIDLPPKARVIYDKLEEDFLAAVEIEGEKSIMLTASNSGVLGQKLRQVANGGLYDDLRRPIHLHDEKAQAVANYYEELAGKALLVAFEFNHDKERLCKALGDPPAVDGDTKTSERLAIMERLNAGKESLVLVQSTLMEGLNLQEACHHIIWHSLTWRADCYIQLIKRVHRMGQKNKVVVAQVIARNTRDERVMRVCRSRVITQEKFLKAIRSYRDG